MKQLRINPVVTRFLGRTAVQLQKYSPEILVGAGILGFVGTVILASKAARKLDSVTEKHDEAIDQIDREFMNIPINLPSAKRHYTRRVARAYLSTAKELSVLYGPTLALGVGSISCFLGSYGVMKTRNASLAAAYSVLQTTFNEYRRRTIEENDVNGVDNDKGKIRSIVKDFKKKGNTKESHDFNSPYCVFFDEFSVYYKRDPYYNLQFLQAQQNYANDMLRVNGHLFLNEVFKMIGLPHTKAGAVTGWVYSSRDDRDKLGDNYVDFGIHLPRNNGFVEGKEPSILMDFNVDGIIFDLI